MGKENKDECIYFQKKLKIELKSALPSKPPDDSITDIQFHPTDAILACFAKIVYDKDIKTENENTFEKYDLKNWALHSYAENDDDKYFGATFYNSKTNQIVISHRGTVPKIKQRKTVLTDIQGIVGNQLTSQIHSACTYCARVLQQLHHHDYINVSITGHSLGAWLGQITTFTSEYLQLNSDKDFEKKIRSSNYKIHTVVFDSPGCYEMLCLISNNYYHKYEQEADNMISALDITIYFNMPNVINCCNSHHFDFGIDIDRIIAIENDSHGFYELCRKKRGSKIFWLHKLPNTFELREVFDQNFYIERYFHQSKVIKHTLCEEVSIIDLEPVHESEVGKSKKKIMVIADEPGMGKSSTLLNIAKQIHKTWVIWVDLINFRGNPAEVPSKANIDTIINFLQKTNKNLKNPIISSMLKYSFLNENSKPIVLFFDRFDELNEEAKRKTIKILKFIKQKTKAKMWITIRISDKNILEDELATLVVKMKEITKEEQLRFIKNFWQTKLMSNLSETAEEFLEQIEKNFKFDAMIPTSRQYYLKSVLDLLMENYETINELIGKLDDYQELCSNFVLNLKQFKFSTACNKLEDNLLKKHPELLDHDKKLFDFLPLAWSLNKTENLFIQRYLTKKYDNLIINKINEILLISYNKVDYDGTNCLLGIPLRLRMITEIFQPEINFKQINFLSLYKEFVSKKIKIYFREKSLEGNKEISEELIFDQHGRLGFQLLFPKQAKDFLEDDILGINENLKEVGLVKILENGEFVFVHNTFADFFAAYKIFQLLLKVKDGWSSSKFEEFFKNDILLKDYKLIRKFLNDNLKKNLNMFEFLKEDFFNFGKNPLHLAIEERNENLAERLLEIYINLNLDIDQVDDEEQSLFHLAVMNAWPKLISKILTRKPGKNIFELTRDNFEVIYLTFSKEDLLAVYFENGDLKIFDRVNEILQKGVLEPSSGSNFLGLLTYARKCNNWTLIRKLMEDLPEQFRDFVNNKNSRGFTLLHDAVIGIEKKMAEDLINIGADVNAVNDDDEGGTPLHYAISSNFWDIAGILIDHGANVNNRDKNNQTVFELAVVNNQIEIVLKLLKIEDVKEEINTFFPGRVVNPLLCAICENFRDLAKVLIVNGADVNVVHKHHLVVAVTMAAAKGQIDVVGELIKYGAEVKDLDGGITPVRAAAVNGHWDVLELLIKEGADLSEEWKNEGVLENVYSLAFRENRTDVFKGFLTNLSLAGLLLHSICYPDVEVFKKLIRDFPEQCRNIVRDREDDWGNRLLNLAAIENKKEVVEVLLEVGADINGVYQQKTHLLAAISVGSWDMAEFLIDHGANANTPHGTKLLKLAVENNQSDIVSKLLKKGEVRRKINEYVPGEKTTYLQVAIRNGYTELAKVLIKHGANVNIAEETTGKTALHAAIEKGSEVMVEELIQRGARINNSSAKITPALLAATSGHRDIVKILIKQEADKYGKIGMDAFKKVFSTGLGGLLYYGIDHSSAEVLFKNLIEDFPKECRAVISNKDHLWGRLLLHLAVVREKKEIVEDLIKMGADINQAHVDNTPLVEAISRRQWDIAQVLIDHGADVNIPSVKSKAKAIQIAAENGGTAIIFKLLNHGAKLEDIPGTKLLKLAVENNQPDIVSRLLERGEIKRKINGYFPGEKVTFLHYAIRKGFPEVANVLINRGADVNIPDKGIGLTAIYSAIEKGYEDIVKELIEHRANINDSCADITPVLYAAVLGQWNIVKLLIREGADANFQLKNGGKIKTVYSLALKANRRDILKLGKLTDSTLKVLLFDAIDCPDAGAFKKLAEDFRVRCTKITSEDWGKLLMHKAIICKKREIVEILLEIGGDIDGIFEGQTPLLAAFSRFNSDMVEFLIEQGANVNIPDENNTTSIRLAAKWGLTRITSKLLSKGAKMKDIQDRPGLTSICIAALKDQWDVVLEKIDHDDADLNIAIAGKSLLQLAVINCQLEAVSKLLEKQKTKARVDDFFLYKDSKDSLECTALQFAILRGNHDIVKVLTTNGANVNIPEKIHGLTALHMATTFGSKDLVEELIKRGVDVNASCSGMKQTPVFIAAEKGHWDIVKLLIKKGADTSGKVENEGEIETVRSLAEKANQVDVLKWLDGSHSDSSSSSSSDSDSDSDSNNSSSDNATC